MMMKKLGVLVLCLMLGFGSLPIQAADPFGHVGGEEAMVASLEAFVQDHQEETVGGSVVVFTSDRVVYQESFGWAKRETEDPMTPQSVIEWGSVTKTLVWVSLMQLEEKGLVDFDVDIRTYLPEDFVAQISYNYPITIKDLMNHQPGYEEVLLGLFVPQPFEAPPLDQALLAYVPKQVFEPGTVTAYSNWGAALGGYLVECVTGESFADYAHDHIFAPLGMDRTALLPDLSDRAEVAKARAEEATYLPNGQVVPFGLLGIPLYPAGMATGSMEDFQAYGQALLTTGPDHPLFEDPETITRLFEPTSTFPSGLTRNAHGFWNTVYALDALGHGGNTASSSSNLLLNPDKGIGVAVMTNQAGETVFNWDLMELVFGSYTDHPTYDPDRFLPRHFFTPYRAVFEGPLSISQLSFMMMEKEDLEDHWELGEREGQTLVYQTYGDMRQLSYGETAAKALPLALVVLGGLYGLGHILGGVVLSGVRRIRKCRRHVALKPWYWLGVLALFAYPGAILYLMALISAFQSAGWVVGASVLLLVLMVLMAISLMGHMRAFFQKDLPARKGLVFVQAIFLASGIGFGMYWELYQFWVLR